jgi:hypothetical protein
MNKKVKPIFFLFIFLFGLFILNGCTKKEVIKERHTPTITTYEVTDVKETSASCSGEIFSDGNMPVKDHGICWSTMPDINFIQDKKSLGGGIGYFQCNIVGLQVDKTYYVWAYVINEAGTWYGNKVEFTTFKGQANLITIPGDNITTSSVQTGGNITYDGGLNIKERGVCWSMNPDPTYYDSKTSEGSGTGLFTSIISGLLANKEYFIRAYAVNDAGIWYGDQQSIFTFGNNIGEQFGGGIIAYIFQPNDPGFVYGETHGFIAPQSDQTFGFWYNGTFSNTGAYRLGLGEGVDNTNDIVLKQGTYSSYAARTCYDFQKDGFDDWWLPTKEELEKLYANKDKIGGFTTNYYWSSSEIDDYNAYTVLFATGFAGPLLKSTSCHVRAIRYF